MLNKVPHRSKIFNTENKVKRLLKLANRNTYSAPRLQDTLIKRCGVNKVRLYPLPPTGRAFKLQYTGSQIFRIIDFLYKDSKHNIRLERKHKHALSLKNRFFINHGDKN